MKPLPGVRERTEDAERASLSMWATLATETKGRDRYEEPDPLRTVFQHDRDRIVSCRAFRRLRDKTQMLLVEAPRAGAEFGHYRLEHALEVTRVARTIARGLRLNEDLVEAIALGHDVGSTPFGDAGEQALSILRSSEFRHNEHSVRVVERLEAGGQGLNLTWEVRDGILNHTDGMPRPATLEGRAVRVADEIVTVLDDLHAALSVGLLSSDDLPALALRTVGNGYDQQIATMVGDAVATSLERPEVTLSEPLQEACSALRRCLVERVSRRPAARAERERAVHCLCSIAVFYLENGERLPDEHSGRDALEARVVDFVAGMTDVQARAEFARLFMPSGSPAS